jgi:hypothetical protein
MMVNFASRTNLGALSSKTQVTINCLTSDRIVRYVMFYDDTYNNGKLIAEGDPEDKWKPIAPNSMSWGVFEIICNK